MLRSFLRVLAKAILQFAARYLMRRIVAQRVWVRGSSVTINTGRFVRYQWRNNSWDEPVGITLFYRSQDEPERQLRVDLSELKFDYGDRLWHFYRPGTPVPKLPRGQQ